MTRDTCVTLPMHSGGPRGQDMVMSHHGGMMRDVEDTAAAIRRMMLRWGMPAPARLPVRPRIKNFAVAFVIKGAMLIDQKALAVDQAITVGRRKDATWVSWHPSISRNHAQLLLTASGIPMIMDMGSIHGTQRNGVPIPPRRAVRLEDNDRITFGQSSRVYFIKVVSVPCPDKFLPPMVPSFSKETQILSLDLPREDGISMLGHGLSRTPCPSSSPLFSVPAPPVDRVQGDDGGHKERQDMEDVEA